ncbi:MAG: hypothetical protein COB81_08185 [Flavobacteriaceae bacterium]|nr:MAG: hypothetical protein COB81_08185 [Flavobacteriaceae bacterium]
MIQRIQSLYLIVAAILSGGIINSVFLWSDSQGVPFTIMDALQSDAMVIKVIPLLFFSSALLSIVAVFMFKHRNRQLGMGRFNILINFILLGVIIYHSLNISGETLVSEKGIGLFFPVLAVVCLVLANNAIKKDEELVKSVDRLR